MWHSGDAMTLRPHRLLLLCCVALLSLASCDRQASDPHGADSLLVDDVTFLNPTRVQGIVRPERVAALQQAIRRAHRDGLQVSIAGARHSQGGHQFVEGGLLIDMTDFDEIIDVDVEAKSVTVETGATWADVQEALDPHGLSVAVMQSSNIFTVGGTISVNAHGRDPRYGPVIETVRSFRLLQANGDIVEVSRQSDAKLFGLALGGYGLFGVIVDVTLDVVADVLYERRIVDMDYRAYPEYFRDRVLGRDDIGLHSARLSIAPGDRFLKEMYASEYTTIAGDATEPLTVEKNVRRDRFFLALSRRYDWGKRLRWYLQRTIQDPPDEVKVVSRNNAMRPPIAFLSYRSDDDTDILQEYFVPPNSFPGFVDGMRDIMQEEKINLLHATVRYVRRSDECFLTYAPDDRFAVVLYMNIDTSAAGIEHARGWTQRLVDLALTHGGTYYLVYQGFPTVAQSRRAYPRLDEFFAHKRAYDPQMMFMSHFYERYAAREHQ